MEPNSNIYFLPFAAEHAATPCQNGGTQNGLLDHACILIVAILTNQMQCRTAGNLD